VKPKYLDRTSFEVCDTVSHSGKPVTASTASDPRAVKSSLALQNALLGLLECKPLEQITVREIAAEAGVHYATFFRHHASKEALLDRVAAAQIDRLVALTVPVLDAVDSRAAFMALCTYVSENRTLWTALLTGGAAGAMREELLRISREIAVVRAPKDSVIPIELATSCTVSLIVETISWWLSHKPDELAIERVAQILHQLIYPLAYQELSQA
jgi:AcrR family transcriptional regulator